MADGTTLTLRLSPETKERLEALAQSTKRSESLLAQEAIEAYLDANARQVEKIERALAQAKAGGPFVPHEEVAAYLDSWGTEHELPLPRARK